MNKQKSTKARIIAPIALIVVICFLIVGEVYAWFAINSQTEVETVNVGVIDAYSDEEGNVDINLGEGVGQEGSFMFLPGDVLNNITLNVTNTTGADKLYRIALSNVTIGYPLANTGYSYSAAAFQSSSYHYHTVVNGVPSDVIFNLNKEFTNDNDRRAFFQNFVSPLTNALAYGAFVVQAPTGDALQNLPTLTEGITSTVEERVSAEVDYTARCLNYDSTSGKISFGISSSGMTADANGHFPIGSEGAYIDVNGNLFLPKDISVTIKMVLYYNPYVYSQYVINSGTEWYTYNNSNAYIDQKFHLKVGLKIVG